jgi:hypothetical protein
VSVFGGIQGGKTGILASFQPLVGPQSSTYPEFPDSLSRQFVNRGNLPFATTSKVAIRISAYRLSAP